MVTSVRFCLLYGLLKAILLPSKSVSMKIFNVLMDLVMKLLVLAESIM